MTDRYIRKVSSTESGSGRIVLPKEYLRELELVDEDGEIVDGHVTLTHDTDDQLVIDRPGRSRHSEADR